MPALVRCLEEDDPSVSSQAAFCLAQIGGQAKAAIPQLTTALRGTNDWVRISAVWALWNIDGETNGASILKTVAMTSSQFPIKNEAAMFFWQMGWKDPELIPVYTSLIQSSDDMLCIGPVMALQKYGPTASNAIPALVQRFDQTGDLHLKQTIWQALMEIDADEAAKHRIR